MSSDQIGLIGWDWLVTQHTVEKAMLRCEYPLP
jgi:hypothetical protein